MKAGRHSSVPSDLGAMTYEKVTLRLTRNRGCALAERRAHASGPRPPFPVPSSGCEAKIFKDDCRPRDRGTDRYKFKVAPTTALHQVHHHATGEDVVVKRSYGSVFTRRLTTPTEPRR